MSGFLGAAYDWVKAAHLIFVIFWMAGLFMLPRYLVYHQEALAAGNAAEAASWIEREGKIRKIILTPAMIVVWVLGLALALNLGLADGATIEVDRDHADLRGVADEDLAFAVATCASAAVVCRPARR